MKNRFIRLTTGWIPASVLLLLATALVYGGSPSGAAGVYKEVAPRGGLPAAIEAAVPDAGALLERRISSRYE
jgi:hypothetical protein